MTSREPRLIALSNSDQFAIVDYEDHHKCIQFDWKINNINSDYKYKYALTYPDSKNMPTAIQLSRFIYGLDRHKGHSLTFVNGNTLDCTRNNLILRNQNLIKYDLLDVTEDDINAVKHKFLISSQNESGYVGVLFCPKKGLWQAKHNDGNGNRSIGSFESKEIAALAYYRCTQEKRKIYGRDDGQEKWWASRGFKS